jgi:hypothetical protein
VKVKCTRDNTVFDAVVEPYPKEGRQSKFYDKSGDKRIQCPTCGRAYFHYDGGTDVVGSKKGWHSDRPLEVIYA